MNMKALIVLTLLFGFFLPAFCDEKAEITNRMAQRLPTINTMKDQGLIGENNLGYLAFRGANQPEAKLIAAENTDRRLAYETISTEIGVPLEEVGKRRAVKIAEKEAPGRWLQNGDGVWYRK
jgi:uncharacterized protein YdbL (DUF1318 family)